MTEFDDDLLDDLFAQTRSTPIAPSDDLMARVMADAARLQPVAVRATACPTQGGLSGWVRDLLGGWPAWGGVVAAGLTGLWVGLAPPASVAGFAATMIGTTQAVSFLPETDLSLFEEPADG